MTEQHDVAEGMLLDFRLKLTSRAVGMVVLHLLQDLQRLDHGARLKLKVYFVIA